MAARTHALMTLGSQLVAVTDELKIAKAELARERAAAREKDEPGREMVAGHHAAAQASGGMQLWADVPGWVPPGGGARVPGGGPPEEALFMACEASADAAASQAGAPQPGSAAEAWQTGGEGAETGPPVGVDTGGEAACSPWGDVEALRGPNGHSSRPVGAWNDDGAPWSDLEAPQAPHAAEPPAVAHPAVAPPPAVPTPAVAPSSLELLLSDMAWGDARTPVAGGDAPSPAEPPDSLLPVNTTVRLDSLPAAQTPPLRLGALFGARMREAKATARMIGEGVKDGVKEDIGTAFGVVKAFKDGRRKS